VLAALPGISWIYLIFTPLTIYPLFAILSLFYPQISLQGATLVLNDITAISLVPACIAGAAYYLLLVINFATPMAFKTRIKSISFLILSFLFLNIIRLVIFIALFINGYQYFDIAHKLTWYFGSTLLVVLLWFVNVCFFKIKAIPAYSDIISLLKESQKKYKTKESSKIAKK
jgi:exosortase/archaeosortase family protein